MTRDAVAQRGQQYPFARPTVPVQLYLLSGLSVFGLAALWLAAFHAFLQVASGPQAFFAATLIEAGLIIEALALIKRPKVWYIWIAVSISLVVSGTYNYIQAAAMAVGADGLPTLNPWQLGTLALGPLSALAFVSLTLGYELREHQTRLEKWQTDRAAWAEARRQETEQREAQEKAELAARLERLQDKERERQEAEALRRFQLEQEDRAWQRHQEELARKRAERAERSRERPEEESPFTAKWPVEANSPRTVESSGERSAELDALLAIIRERSAGQPYSSENVQEWTGLGRTKAFEVLKYGRTFGEVHQVGKGQYVNNGVSQ